MGRNYVTVTNMYYLGHLMSFLRLDPSEVSYIGLELPGHSRFLSCPDLPYSCSHPVFAVSYSHKGYQIMFILSHCEVGGCS